jgi:hypothetical protein
MIPIQQRDSVPVVFHGYSKELLNHGKHPQKWLSYPHVYLKFIMKLLHPTPVVCNSDHPRYLFSSFETNGLIELYLSPERDTGIDLFVHSLM